MVTDTALPWLFVIMMHSNQQKLPGHVHFIGICGKGMRGVADALAKLGVHVTGSDDLVFSGADDWVRARGMDFKPGFSASSLEPAPDLVLIGRSYGRGNIEVETVLERRLPYDSFPSFLEHYFLRSSRNLVVAGSKGKTTTTAMSAWIMERAGLNPGYLVAGTSPNLDDEARFGDRAFHVLEGDDYSTLWYDHNPKFCYYRPEAVILTNILDDHPEIHIDDALTLRNFKSLINQIPRHGILVTGCDHQLARQVCRDAPSRVVRVGFDEAADTMIRDFEQTDHGIRFSLEGTVFTLPLYGKINAINAALAAVADRHFGISLESSAEALREFQGVRGRMENLGTAGGVTCYTDLGYLPECMGSTLEALRKRHEGRRLVFLFQPHVLEGLPRSHPAFLEVLTSCDLVLLADVYRPRLYDAQNPGFSNEMAGRLAALGVTCARIGPIEDSMVDAMTHLHPGDVLVGVIHPKYCDVLPKLLELLEERSYANPHHQ